MFVRVGETIEPIIQKAEIVLDPCAVTRVLSLLEMKTRRRVFDERAIRVVLLSFDRAQRIEHDAEFHMIPTTSDVTAAGSKQRRGCGQQTECIGIARGTRFDN